MPYKPPNEDFKRQKQTKSSQDLILSLIATLNKLEQVKIELREKYPLVYQELKEKLKNI